MNDRKIIGFKIPVKLHAELKARLYYDELPMTKFIRAYITGYLKNDPLILDFIKEYKEENNDKELEEKESIE